MTKPRKHSWPFSRNRKSTQSLRASATRSSKFHGNAVETTQWREANILAGGMVVFAFVVILSMILIQKRYAMAGA